MEGNNQNNVSKINASQIFTKIYEVLFKMHLYNSNSGFKRYFVKLIHAASSLERNDFMQLFVNTHINVIIHLGNGDRFFSSNLFQ